MLISFKGIEPRLAEAVLVCPGAVVIGDVFVGRGSSIWFNAVVRGDLAPIRIGEETNIQDGALLHVDVGCPLQIGDRVTIGHGAVVHGCTIDSGALIGMGAVVMNGARVGLHAMVGAGALVPQGMEVPQETLAIGVPARVVRRLTAEEIKQLEASARNYVAAAGYYASHQ